MGSVWIRQESHSEQVGMLCCDDDLSTDMLSNDAKHTSGYPWSNPIRLNNFSYELSLIGIFLDGLTGTIVLPQDNLYLPPDHSWDGPFGGSQDG